MQEPEEPVLPYGGDIQAAIRNQDRDAVKQLLAVRSEEHPEESKEAVNADALHDALMALGFAEVQVAEAFPASGDEKLSTGVKRLLESDRQLPKPKKQRDINSSLYDNRVTEQMLRRIDAESIWVLMQVGNVHVILCNIIYLVSVIEMVIWVNMWMCVLFPRLVTHRQVWTFRQCLK